MNNRKGFTLVEILVTVAILGILTTVAVISVSNLTKKAKAEKDTQNVNTLKMAAESYTQANKEYLPKLVGEWTTINISDLSKSNYIKEEITNQNNKSCMTESYVDITKISKKDYVYQPHLICDGEEITPPKDDDEVETTPEIIITINGLKPGEDVTSENIVNANYSIAFKGDKNDKNIGILSYNYSMFVKNIDKDTNEESEAFEVYNSGNQIGNSEPEISVSNININKYLNVTGKNEVTIKGFLVNEKGVRKTETSTIQVMGGDSVSISDNTPPVCPTTPDGRKGEPDNTNWLNKKDIKDGAKRKISLVCNDGEGSGCKRQKFSRTWPNKTEQEAKKSIKESTITLTDNNNNSIDCNVNVNIDVESPELSVLKDENIKNTITVEANNNYDQLDQKETIESNDNYYNNLYNKKWLNGSNYPNGITYSVEASDDIGIKTIKWQTTNRTNNGSTTDEQINIDTSNNNDFTYEINNEGKKIYKFNVRFIHDGEREGTLTVEDAAGNKATIIIKANLDREPPKKPTVSMYKWNNNNSEPNSSNGLQIYNQNNIEEWSNKNIYSEATNTTDSVSKIDENSYQSTLTKSGQATNKNGKNLNITVEGKMQVKYKVCDNAGNCIETDSYNVWIDKTNPTCEYKVTPSSTPNKNGWITTAGSKVTITAKCADELSECEEPKEYSHEYTEEINTTEAGAGENGGPVTVKDNAGNEATCPANQEVKMDWTPPTIPEVEVYKWKSNNKFPMRENDLLMVDKKSTLHKLDDNCVTDINKNECDWIDSKVLTKAKSVDNISGLDSYHFTATGATAYENGHRATRTIEADGKSTISYYACDKAGNCSDQNTSIVYISKYAPTITCKYENGKITNINITTNGNNYYFNDCNNVTSDKSKCKPDPKYNTFVISAATTAAGIKDKWGTTPNYQSCGKTYYAYVRAKSASSGKETIAKCSGSYSTKTCNECKESTPENCPWVTSCRLGNTALYRDKNIYAWAGTTYHSLNGRNDKIYVLPITEDTRVKKYGIYWRKVYIPAYDRYYENTVNNNYVFIAENCLGPSNKVCPYTQCPG